MIGKNLFSCFDQLGRFKYWNMMQDIPDETWKRLSAGQVWFCPNSKASVLKVNNSARNTGKNECVVMIEDQIDWSKYD